jgi:hypothetical protein
VEKLQAQLKEIDESRVDGKFLNASGQPAAGSDEVSDLLRKCLLWSDIVLERYASRLQLDKFLAPDHVGDRIKPYYQFQYCWFQHCQFHCCKCQLGEI